METPKWGFFDRIEKLEPKVAKLEPKVAKLEPKVEDVYKMGMVSFRLAFLSWVDDRPAYARKIKDIVGKMLKEVGLRRSVAEEIEDYMLSVCEEVEELRKGQ